MHFLAIPNWGLILSFGGVVPCQSSRRGPGVLLPAIFGWGLLLPVVGWVVPRQSWRREVLVLFPAVPGWGMLLAFVGWVAPCQSWRRPLWVQRPAIPGWGLLVPLLGWVVPRPFGGGPFVCCSLSFPFGAVGFLRGGRVVPRQSWRRVVWVQCPAIPS